MKKCKYELFMRESDCWDDRYNATITNSAEIIKFLKDVVNLDKRDRETVVAVALNTKGAIIGYNEVSVGDISSSLIHPREYFKFLVLSNAAAGIIAHNHPSGCLEASGDDIKTTKTLIKCGNMMHIPLYDHIIISQTGAYSLKEDDNLCLWKEND